MSSGTYGADDELPEAARDDPLSAALFRGLGKLEGVGGAARKWQDEHKLGNLVVDGYVNAAHAHRSMPVTRTFARGWAKIGGGITKDEEVEGLGDEAWRLWAVNNGHQVTYEWRRGNLVMQVHVHCFGVCPSDIEVDAATRDWVDILDDEAQSLG